MVLLTSGGLQSESLSSNVPAAEFYLLVLRLKLTARHSFCQRKVVAPAAGRSQGPHCCILRGKASFLGAAGLPEPQPANKSDIDSIEDVLAMMAENHGKVRLCATFIS